MYDLRLRSHACDGVPAVLKKIRGPRTGEQETETGDLG